MTSYYCSGLLGLDGTIVELWAVKVSGTNNNNNNNNNNKNFAVSIEWQNHSVYAI